MISKIEIRGYKSIKEVSVALKPVNLLIGSNGVGKSNFISFFKFLNAIYEQRLETYSMKYGADDLLFFGRKHTEEIVARIDFDNRNAYSFVLNGNNEDKLFVNSEYRYYNRTIAPFGWKSYSVSSNSAEARIKQDTTEVGAYVKEYLESFKVYHFHDTSENAYLRTACDVNDNQYLRENGSNLPAYLFLLQQKHPTNFRRIEKAIQSIAPFFERFNLLPQRLNNQKIALEWIEKNHPDKYFNAAHLSDGTMRFIALATLLLQPEPPHVIIIDEPELGLHPVAINKLAGLLRSAEGKKRQIIISTQSVNLVNNFNADEIITVDRNGDESVFARLDEQELHQWLDEYTIGDLWSKNIIKGQP